MKDQLKAPKSKDLTFYLLHNDLASQTGQKELRPPPRNQVSYYKTVHQNQLVYVAK